jgi:hypothetical protein
MNIEITSTVDLVHRRVYLYAPKGNPTVIQVYDHQEPLIRDYGPLTTILDDDLLLDYAVKEYHAQVDAALEAEPVRTKVGYELVYAKKGPKGYRNYSSERQSAEDTEFTLRVVRLGPDDVYLLGAKVAQPTPDEEA